MYVLVELYSYFLIINSFKWNCCIRVLLFRIFLPIARLPSRKVRSMFITISNAWVSLFSLFLHNINYCPCSLAVLNVLIYISWVLETLRFSRFLVIYISFVSCLLSLLCSFLLGTQIDRWMGCVGRWMDQLLLSDSLTLWTCSLQAPLSVAFPRQESWNQLPFPSPGDLPDPGTKCVLTSRFFTTEPPGKDGSIDKDYLHHFQSCLLTLLTMNILFRGLLHKLFFGQQ